MKADLASSFELQMADGLARAEPLRYLNLFRLVLAGFFLVAGRPLQLGGDSPTLFIAAAIAYMSAVLILGFRDAERLQGFAADWTAPVADVVRPTFRWKLVGNAVSVPTAEWIGRRLVRPGPPVVEAGAELEPGSPWPSAAAAADGVRRRYAVSHFPEAVRRRSLMRR